MMKSIVLSLFFSVALIALTWLCTRPPQPFVSVIMPTYNRADLLPRSIESILNQTYKNFEFIIIDDGSTDASLEILKKYKMQDARIILLINDKNRGISYSRNRGLNAAKGKYIMNMDSDDESLPHRMEKQVAFLESHPDISLVTAMKKGMDGIIRTRMPMYKFQPRALFSLFIGHPEWMLRRSFVETNRLRYNEELKANVDYDFYVNFLIAHGRVGYIEEPLLLRRYHRTNSEEYYDEQHENVRKTHRRFWRAFGVPEDLIEFVSDKKQSCLIYRFAVVANKEKKFLEQDVLENFTSSFCGISPF